MRDVAAAAGVSLSTVSRVVNGIEVQSELGRRVREALLRLDYRPDQPSPEAPRDAGAIGLVCDDIADPFFAALQRGIEDVAYDRGSLAFAASSDTAPGREREVVSGLAARGIKGLIVAPAATDERHLRREREAGLALVFVDRPPRWLEVDAVLSDNAGGTRAAVAHLAVSGHRRIAFLGDREWLFTATERLRGYREGVAAVGAVADKRLARLGLANREAARETALELLYSPEPPTALLASTRPTTLGALDAVRAAASSNGAGRVAVIGFDDVALAGAVGIPVVAQDPRAMGHAAARLLFARLEGREGRPGRLVIPTRLLAPPSRVGSAV
ncbi:LacI family DNA-binding transcriptional regulator [Candidatus Solirubrobacter pratensis]|uniref:LacI family DNA-binding transcriptional regulator n=1 Tax=Candidatus Solirubrobacter pratensis TaxID=1298857 RepID=UPI000421BC63|nr:LacI family DNA-binding transcriptional regulator [Candidatus Solirubrobacter pratensis]